MRVTKTGKPIKNTHIGFWKRIFNLPAIFAGFFAKMCVVYYIYTHMRNDDNNNGFIRIKRINLTHIYVLAYKWAYGSSPLF